MISFFDVNDTERFDGALAREGILRDDYVSEVLDNFLSLSESVGSVYITVSHGCFIARIYDDGQYLFVFPIMLTDGADVGSVLIALSEYVRREMLTFVLTDVPRDCLDVITESFAYVDAMAYEDDEDFFAVAVKNELDMAEELPVIVEDDIRLTLLTDLDTAAYTRLCCDRELNKYWGYDALADNPALDPEIFMQTAEREREQSIALSLAIRRDGKYLGEAVLYDFDYRRGAEVGIRVLPEYQGDGIGLKALDAAIKYARAIGLETLRARVMVENTAAIRMTKKRMVEIKREDGVVHFFAPVTGFELEG